MVTALFILHIYLKQFFFFAFHFVLSYSQVISNVVIVSGVQHSDSVICIHVFILPQTPLSSRLPRSMEQSSLSVQ